VEDGWPAGGATTGGGQGEQPNWRDSAGRLEEQSAERQGQSSGAGRSEGRHGEAGGAARLERRRPLLGRLEKRQPAVEAEGGAERPPAIRRT
jgi:hypothetical protein